MLLLRNFANDDTDVLSQWHGAQMTSEEIRSMIALWNKKEHNGKYFEMFAVVKDGEIVGSISLYQLSDSMVSCGPEIFACCRGQGLGAGAMALALEVAKDRGFKIVMQQVRTDNAASVALHEKLGFETDGYLYQNKKGNEVRLYMKPLP